MRSSKSRSRSKSNRPRSIGNIINRVFDSSGPEGKVRGTPQQIIEKYQFLARDAQLSNDRVAAENFMQHAEHYTRLLAEAQRELAAEQDARRPNGEMGQNGNQNGGQNGNQNGGQGGGQNRDRPYRDDQRDDRSEQRDDRADDRNDNRGDRGERFEPRAPRIDPRDEQPEVVVPQRGAAMMDFIDELGDSGLVETPEARSRIEPQRQENYERRDRQPRPDQPRRDDRKPRPEFERRPVPVVTEAPAAPAAEPEAAKAAKPRAPRKPKPAEDAVKPKAAE